MPTYIFHFSCFDFFIHSFVSLYGIPPKTNCAVLKCLREICSNPCHESTFRFWFPSKFSYICFYFRSSTFPNISGYFACHQHDYFLSLSLSFHTCTDILVIIHPLGSRQRQEISIPIASNVSSSLESKIALSKRYLIFFTIRNDQNWSKPMRNGLSVTRSMIFNHCVIALR